MDRVRHGPRDELLVAAMVDEPRAALAEASRIVREALKDKSYRSTPLGLEVARYIRWKRTEWGAAPDTIRDYESVLARLAIFFADLELKDFETPVGAERLRECWDFYWSDKSGRTRAKVLSIWRDFFDWAVREQRGIHGNPARMLRSPKHHDVKREPYGKNLVDSVIAGQSYLADKLGVILVLLYGIRRAELGAVRFRDFDFERRTLTVVGKGSRVRGIPIVDEPFWRDLGALELELGGHDQVRDLYLLYRQRTVGMNVYRYHHLQLSPHTVGTGWWYRCLAAAGIVEGDREGGTWKGLGMHRGRHTVASDILRKTGRLEAAQALLGHANIGTTIDSYAAFNDNDLRNVLLSMRKMDEDE